MAHAIEANKALETNLCGMLQMRGARKTEQHHHYYESLCYDATYIIMYLIQRHGGARTIIIHIKHQPVDFEFFEQEMMEEWPEKK